MSPSAASLRPGAASEQRERGAHRGRVGVVALVDQRDRAVRPAQPVALRRGPWARGSRRARAPRGSGIGAERRGAGEHAQAVAHPVAPGRADPVGDLDAVERHRRRRCRPARAARPAGGRAAPGAAPKPITRPQPAASAICRELRGMRIVQVQHRRRRPARGRRRSRPWPRRSPRPTGRSRDGRARSR